MLGPNGFDETPTLISKNPNNVNAFRIDAVFRLSNAFSFASNGTYNVNTVFDAAQNIAVSDVAGNKVGTRFIDFFQVSIPDPNGGGQDLTQNNQPSSFVTFVSDRGGNGGGATPGNAILQRSLRANSLGHNANLVGVESYNGNTIQIGSSTGQTGCKTLRLPGGDTANYWDQSRNGLIGNQNDILPLSSVYQPELVDRGIYAHDKALPISIAYRDFFLTNTPANIASICNNAGVTDVTWCINMVTQKDPQVEINTIQTLIDAGVPIKRIELGNELYFATAPYGANVNGSADAFPNIGFRTSQQYAQDCKNIWMPALYNAFPNLPLIPLAWGDNGNTNNFGLENFNRLGSWNNYMKQEGLHLLPGFGGFSEHPYYSTNTIGLTLNDVGDRAKANSAAIAAYNAINSKMDVDSFNIFPSDTPFWITETAILDESAYVIVGQTWLACLIICINHLVLYKDARVQAIYNHVLQGNYYWDAVTDEVGSYPDPNQRGLVNQPRDTSTYPSFTPTLQGLAQQLWGEVFNQGGTAYLYHDEPAVLLWRVVDGTFDKMVAVNSLDAAKSLTLPSDRSWSAKIYTPAGNDPWYDPIQPNALPPFTISNIAAGGVLSMPPFSLAVLEGLGVGEGIDFTQNNPPISFVSGVSDRGTGDQTSNNSPSSVVTASSDRERLWLPSDDPTSRAWYDFAEDVTVDGSGIYQGTASRLNGEILTPITGTTPPAVTATGITLNNSSIAVQSRFGIATDPNVAFIFAGDSGVAEGAGGGLRMICLGVDINFTDGVFSLSPGSLQFTLGQAAASWRHDNGFSTHDAGLSTPGIFAAYRTPGTYNTGRLRVNGIEATQTDTNNGGPPTSTTATFAVGRPGMTGSVRGLIVMESADIPTIQKAVGYLAHKHGLTQSLPAGHPYKNNPPTVAV